MRDRTELARNQLTGSFAFFINQEEAESLIERIVLKDDITVSGQTDMIISCRQVETASDTVTFGTYQISDLCTVCHYKRGSGNALLYGCRLRRARRCLHRRRGRLHDRLRFINRPLNLRIRGRGRLGSRLLNLSVCGSRLLLSVRLLCLRLILLLSGLGSVGLHSRLMYLSLISGRLNRRLILLLNRMLLRLRLILRLLNRLCLGNKSLCRGLSSGLRLRLILRLLNRLCFGNKSLCRGLSSWLLRLILRLLNRLCFGNKSLCRGQRLRSGLRLRSRLRRVICLVDSRVNIRLFLFRKVGVAFCVGRGSGTSRYSCGIHIIMTLGKGDTHNHRFKLHGILKCLNLCFCLIKSFLQDDFGFFPIAYLAINHFHHFLVEGVIQSVE